MQIDIKLNIGTFILLSVIGGLGYALYDQRGKIKTLKEENEVLRNMKGE